VSVKVNIALQGWFYFAGSGSDLFRFSDNAFSSTEEFGNYESANQNSLGTTALELHLRKYLPVIECHKFQEFN